MVGGMIGGQLHFRCGWRWKKLLNLCAYSVKDPSVLTTEQRFSRIYRACLRRVHLLAMLKFQNNHGSINNFVYHAQNQRNEFEALRNSSAEEQAIFIKNKEEWLEQTFFPAVSQWPTRKFTNKLFLNLPYPDPYHDYDPIGYYKPKPMHGTAPSSGLYFQEYPLAPNFFIIPDRNDSDINDPYLKEQLEKASPAMAERAKRF